MTEGVLLIVGIISFIAIVVLIQNYKYLRTVRLIKPKIKKNDRQYGDYDEVARNPRFELENLGFSYFSSFSEHTILGCDDLMHNNEVYSNGEMVVSFCLKQFPEKNWIWEFRVFSISKNGKIYLSASENYKNLPRSFKGIVYQHCLDRSFEKIIDSHKLLISNVDCVCCTEDEFLLATKIFHDNFFDYCIEKNIISHEEDYYRFNKIDAVKISLRLLLSHFRSKKPNVADKEFEPSPIINYICINTHLGLYKNQVNNPLTKWFVFAFSLLLFAFAFGFLKDWMYLLIIILVILIHELGHAFFMKVFGYKDISILFIPFLGAAATGKRVGHIAAWKEIIILLAGPMPGIIIGVGLYIWANLKPQTVIDEASINTIYLAMMFIIINGFNLLPINPLDGGKIIDILYLKRWPLLGSLFSLFSGVSLIGIGYYLDATFLSIIGVFLVLGLKRDMGTRKILIEIQNKIKEIEINEVELDKLIISKMNPKLVFAAKLEMFKNIKASVYQRMAGVKTTLFFTAMIVLFLIGSLFFTIPLMDASGWLGLGLNYSLMEAKDIPPEDIPELKKLCAEKNVYQVSGILLGDSIRYNVSMLEEDINKDQFRLKSNRLVTTNHYFRGLGDLDSAFYNKIFKEGELIEDSEAYSVELSDSELDSIEKINAKNYQIVSQHEDSIWNTMDSIAKLGYFEKKYLTHVNYNDSCLWFFKNEIEFE